MRKTRIVIPCYNEAARLTPQAFLSALDKDENLSFLFVNDGSTDNTLALLEAVRAKNPTQVEVLNLVRNSGKAEAVRQGMLRAIESSIDLAGYWDADLATPLETIDKFCRQFDNDDVDLVVGSRVRLLGRRIERRALRHYLGRLFATFSSLLLGISVYDTQCGAKIFRNSDCVRKVFRKPFKVTWIFDVEMLARLPVLQGESPDVTSSRWIEYPLDQWVDVKGSNVNMSGYIRSLFEFCLLFFLLFTPARRRYEKYLLNE